jgi:transposase
MIQINQIWLSTTAMDMRSGSNKLIAHIIKQHQGIKPHCAYLFYNKTGTRLKVLIHDGLGVWLCNRHLDDSKFHGLGKQLISASVQTGISLTQPQFNALISGLPWHNIDKEIITPII